MSCAAVRSNAEGKRVRTGDEGGLITKQATAGQSRDRAWSVARPTVAAYAPRQHINPALTYADTHAVTRASPAMTETVISTVVRVRSP